MSSLTKHLLLTVTHNLGKNTEKEVQHNIYLKIFRPLLLKNSESVKKKINFRYFGGKLLYIYDKIID